MHRDLIESGEAGRVGGAVRDKRGTARPVARTGAAGSLNTKRGARKMSPRCSGDVYWRYKQRALVVAINAGAFRGS